MEGHSVQNEKGMTDRSDQRRLSLLFAALSDETRMKILALLERRPRSVNEVVDMFTLTQPTITRHLQTLHKAGLVNVKREGLKKLYSLDESALRKAFSEFGHTFKCCQSMLDKGSN
jgi:ArsR family transcriptional regulator